MESCNPNKIDELILTLPNIDINPQSIQIIKSNIYRYNCTDCAIHTNNKQTYDRHVLSKRHKERIQDNTQYIHVCTSCNKKYKSNVGLWKHTITCSSNNLIDVSEIKESISELKTMIIDLKTNQPVTNSVTHNNNNNTNFNVNLFLNENLTNATNFVDMINNIQLDTVYHDKISSNDYVATMVRMIKSEIDKLPILERPIQCIKHEDEHQQILHIRHNNKWQKETELEWTQQIHNYYIDDEDEPEEEDRKVIFYAIKQMEDNIVEQIKKLYANSGRLVEKTREYKYEMDYVPNKMRIIKCLIEHVNLEREEIMRIIDEAYNQIRMQTAEI
jgi:hypothetical protein